MIKWALKNQVLILFVVVFLLGWGFGFVFGKRSVRCPDCPKCPEIVQSRVSERDSSVKQPTEVRVVYVDRYVTSKETRKAFVNDSPVVVEKQESVNCWETPKIFMDDSASISMKLCSRLIGDRPPIDLESSFDYTPSPHVRIIERRNDVLMPCPSIRGRRFGLSVGPYVGYGIDFYGNRGATVGVAIMWGVRLGKLTKG